jgi:cbb3-type cytochrome c oxidase subunit III
MQTRLQISLALAALCGGIASTAFAQNASFEKLQRGKYLVDAGDCVSCHTKPQDGKPFAGGRPIETPFGTIYSPNITPDRDSGIGAWSDDDFYRAVHSGIGPDGKRLYPAFPYPYFTKMTREDVLAMRAYLNTLTPVNNRRPEAELIWPLQYRVFMRGWDWLFFHEGTFAPDPQKSAEWNRGAYLVEGPGHCGACHTPKNALGGDKTSEPLQGNQIQNWFAPELANDSRSGLGAWSVDDIVEYLKTGRNSHSGATGLMAEAVANSTSKLTDADLHAIAVYIKDVSGPSAGTPAKPAQASMDAGAAIFADSCSACHEGDGKGVARMFPPLVHNANVQSADPTSIIRVILEGARTVPTDARPTPSSMPAFGWKLGDDEVAAVATYVRNSWGNAAAAVTADQVKSLRNELHAKTQ